MNVATRLSPAKGTCGAAVGLAGTATLRTPCGGRRAENIRQGDLIVTRDNGLQPVRLVWRRTVTAADIAADPSLAPVRLAPRAVGPMMPQRPLVLAAGQRVLVPGWRLADMPDNASCLVAARDIAEAADLAHVERDVTEITYYNIVFDAQQVFAVDGLPVESYRPTPDTLGHLDEATGRALSELFPSAAEDAAAYPATGYPALGPEDRVPEFV